MPSVIDGLLFDDTVFDGDPGPQSFVADASASLVLSAAAAKGFAVSATVSLVLGPIGDSLVPVGHFAVASPSLVVSVAAATTLGRYATAGVTLKFFGFAGSSGKRFAPSFLIVSASASVLSTRSVDAALTLTFTAAAPIAGKKNADSVTAPLVVAVRADSRVLLPGAPGTLRAAYQTGRSGRYPFWFGEVTDGAVLISNGVDPMLRWDGIGRSVEVAGVPAPETAATIDTLVDVNGAFSDGSVPLASAPGGVAAAVVYPTLPITEFVFPGPGTHLDVRIPVAVDPVHNLNPDGTPAFTTYQRSLYHDFIAIWQGPTNSEGKKAWPNVLHLNGVDWMYSLDASSPGPFSYTLSQLDPLNPAEILAVDPTAPLQTDPLALAYIGPIPATYTTATGQVPSDPAAARYVGYYLFNNRLYSPTAAPPTTTQPSTVLGKADPGSIYAYVRFLDRLGNVSDFGPISAGVTSLSTYVYNNVPLPTGPYASKVVRRQILRNTDGEATVWYVDVDTTDLQSTTFLSTATDADIKTHEAVPLFDDLGGIFANIHGFPPSHKMVTTMHLGRAFAAGEVTYTEGSVQVVAGSDQVVGVGTEWPFSFVGRDLWVAGAPQPYPIADVDAIGQVLTLERGYGGKTDPFATYAVRAAPPEKRLVYYTPAGQPESWPAFYALSVQEDGDEIVGLMQLSSFLYILERRHIYRFTFKDDPATDGAVFLSTRRGCLNARLWVQAEDTAYMLDELGVHAFSGGISEPISAQVQDLFRDNTASPLRINWEADSTLWSSSYSEVHGTVRFFVAMTGSRYPRHALCYNYREQRWWIEEYMRPVCSCARTRIGVIRTLAGLDHREVAALDVGYTDGARDVLGSIRGTATFATPCSLEDDVATFAADAVNCAVFMVSGASRGQWRRIAAVAPTRLVTMAPWTVKPREGDSYVVAGIEWQWRGGTFRFVDPTEPARPRDVEMIFQPLAEDSGPMALRLYYNRSGLPRSWEVSRDGAATVTAGHAEVMVDMTELRGRALLRLEGHKEHFIEGDQYVSPELGGVQCDEPVRIFRVTFNGVEVDA